MNDDITRNPDGSMNSDLSDCLANARQTLDTRSVSEALDKSEFERQDLQG